MTFFKAEDFEKMQYWFPQTLAKHCNEKLQREAKVVYTDNLVHWGSDQDQAAIRDTHRALLVCIEPLVKPKCEHSVNFKTATPLLLNDQQIFQCSKCPQKIKLKWEWEVLDEQR